MIKFKLWISLLVLVLSACGGGGGDTGGTGGTDGEGTVTLPTRISWIAPTENTDDSSLDDLSKYRIYYGSDVTSLKVVPELDIDAMGGSVSSFYISSLNAAELEVLKNLVKDNTTHFFAMTAVNTQNIESSFSNIVSFP